jgi:lipoyl(octanoyl) transferase
MLASKLSDAPLGFTRADGQSVDWLVSPGLTPYEPAVALMQERAQAVAAGRSRELVWLVEHASVYTAGVSSRPEDLLDAARFPVVQTGRGGQLTYHGPGQRVVYLMLDLSARRRDVHAFVGALERWLILTLGELGVEAEIKPGRVGVWVTRRNPPREDKIAAIGVKIRRWTSFHGVALNVSPTLDHFSGIVPCGIREHGVTSLQDLGLPMKTADADEALRRAFEAVFGQTKDAEPDL